MFIDALLAQLSYPGASGLTGMATWSAPAEDGRCAHAWVRWDGQGVSAHLADPVPGSPGQVLEITLEWAVEPTGYCQPRGAFDEDGQVSMLSGMRCLLGSIADMGAGAFVPMPPAVPPRRLRH